MDSSKQTSFNDSLSRPNISAISASSSSLSLSSSRRVIDKSISSQDPLSFKRPLPSSSRPQEDAGMLHREGTKASHSLSSSSSLINDTNQAKSNSNTTTSSSINTSLTRPLSQTRPTNPTILNTSASSLASTATPTSVSGNASHIVKDEKVMDCKLNAFSLLLFSFDVQDLNNSCYDLYA